MKRRAGGGPVWKEAQGFTRQRQRRAISVAGSCTENSWCFGGTVRSPICFRASVGEMGAVDS